LFVRNKVQNLISQPQQTQMQSKPMRIVKNQDRCEAPIQVGGVRKRCSHAKTKNSHFCKSHNSTCRYVYAELADIHPGYFNGVYSLITFGETFDDSGFPLVNGFLRVFDYADENSYDLYDPMQIYESIPVSQARIFAENEQVLVSLRLEKNHMRKTYTKATVLCSNLKLRLYQVLYYDGLDSYVIICHAKHVFPMFSLKESVVIPEHVEQMSEPDECPICLDPMINGVRVPVCECMFCSIECIQNWFKNHETCPTCRRDVDLPFDPATPHLLEVGRESNPQKRARVI
jgi:hypothetical protein